VAGGFRAEGLVLGFILVAVGVLWTLSNLGRIELLTTLRTWWPLALVVWGLVELAAVAIRGKGTE
jgi:hypothetical protein